MSSECNGGTERSLRIAIENLDTARFRCVFPECRGICCERARPGVTVRDVGRIRGGMDKALPRLRPEVRRYLERHPWLTRRRKEGLPTLAVAVGACVFFNEGCVLQKVGMEEGEPWRYKPEVCARFPVEPIRGQPGRYYVRQWGYRGEAWDLFCLDPRADPTPAAASLGVEVRLVEELHRRETSRSPEG